MCVSRVGVKPSCYVSYQTASNPWTCTEIVDGSNDPVWCHENDCRLSSDLLTSGNSVCCICCQLLLFTRLFFHVNPVSWLLLGFLPPLVLEQNCSVSDFRETTGSCTAVDGEPNVLFWQMAWNVCHKSLQGVCDPLPD